MNDDELDEFTAALHDVVLPLGVPVLPGLALAAHFSVPADPGESTGAWFDVVQLRSGRVALVMGQVPGSGPAAVAGASAVGAVLRAQLLCDEDVVSAIRTAALHAEHTPAATSTAAVAAILDPEAGQLLYATAGHAGPVVASADGGVRELPRTGTRPLGPEAEAVQSQAPLAVGDLVLLSSPVVGEPDTDVARLLEGSRVGNDTVATCEAYAAELARRQVRGAVAVVAAEVREVRQVPLELDVPADDETTRRARHELADWLSELGASQTDVLSLVHATAELVTNAVEHAYSGSTPGGQVRLSATHTAQGEVLVEVSDNGQWREPVVSDIGRGRGLAMAAGLVDDLVVTSDEAGTHARAHHRLTRPVLVDRTPLRPAWPAAQPLAIEQTAPGVVRLSGELGHDEVDQITYALLLASHGRTQALEIDLSDVTAVSVGGLGMLGDLVRDPEHDTAVDAGHAPVTLLARRGSVSQVELERAGIAHRAS